MANNKQRYLNTRFWNDNFVADLNPVDKLLFIYFLTNEHTNISGIYELPLKIMSVETGIEISMIKKMLPRLSSKVRYLDGKIIIKNFVKHQETKSPLVKQGIINCLNDLDKEWLKNVISKGYYVLDKNYTDTLYIPYIYSLNYSDSNLDSNSNSKDTVVAVATTFSFEEEMKKLKDSDRKDFKIIALYWSKKKFNFENKKQFESALKRELRAAKELTGYSGEQIARAIKYCQDNYEKVGWTLETINKRISDVVSKK